MIFQGISSTWKEAFSVFKWSDLKLLLLVSLKTSVTAIKVLLKNFWWLYILYFGMQYFNTPLLIIVLMQVLLVFIMFMAVRPSLERKDLQYFIKYLKFIPAFLLLLVIPPMQSALGAIVVLLVSVSCLFYLDSNGGLVDIGHSIIRGVTSIVYFLPAYIGLTLVAIIPFLLIGLLLLSAFTYLHPASIVFFSVVVGFLSSIYYLFFLSLITNYYTKVKHAHNKLFFK